MAAPPLAPTPYQVEGWGPQVSFYDGMQKFHGVFGLMKWTLLMEHS